MTTNASPSTTVREWLDDRQRRRSRKAGPKHRHVFPSANVVSMSSFSYAKACRDFEIADAALKLAQANLQRVEDGIRREFSSLIALIKKEVLAELMKKPARRPKK